MKCLCTHSVKHPAKKLSSPTRSYLATSSVATIAREAKTATLNALNESFMVEGSGFGGGGGGGRRGGAKTEVRK